MDGVVRLIPADDLISQPILLLPGLHVYFWLTWADDVSLCLCAVQSSFLLVHMSRYHLLLTDSLLFSTCWFSFDVVVDESLFLPRIRFSVLPHLWQEKGINSVGILPHLARSKNSAPFLFQVGIIRFFLPNPSDSSSLPNRSRKESKEGVDSSKSEVESEWQEDHHPIFCFSM